MASYLARRTGYMVLILAISSVVIFYALRSAPGGPSGGGVLSPLSSQEVRQAYEKRLGLDQPVYTQYFIYLSHLAKGDLGTSLVNGTPITELLATHARNSLVLGLTALAISYLIAIPLGVLAAVKRNTWVDQLAMGGAILGMGIPNFWLALILVYFFSLRLGPESPSTPSPAPAPWFCLGLGRGFPCVCASFTHQHTLPVLDDLRRTAVDFEPGERIAKDVAVRNRPLGARACAEVAQPALQAENLP